MGLATTFVIEIVMGAVEDNQVFATINKTCNNKQY